MNILALFAALACAQFSSIVGFGLPEAQADVQPALVVKVRAELRVNTHFGQEVEQAVQTLQKKYGFVPDQTFTPQAVLDDKQYTILPYDGSGGRPMVFLIKGFINEKRMPELARDQAVRKVEQDGAGVEASAEELHKFVQGYGHLLLTVKGVKAIGVGEEQLMVLGPKPVLVIVLEPGVNRDQMAEQLRRRVPALPVLPHRYEQAPAGKPQPRFTTQG
jgi:peptidoglycan hydrolase-like protein with peptidoglycan-binding domain